MIKRIFITSLLSVILAAVCAAQSDPRNFVQTGNATQDMDSDELVAGHAFLPIGQEVTVTNLDSGAQATVTITERIPQSTSRIINLTPTAAAAIVMFDESSQVTLEAKLQPAAPAAAAAPSATPTPAVAPVPAAAPAVTPAPAVAAPAVVPAPAPVAAAPSATPTPAVAPVPVAAPAPAVAPAPVPSAASAPSVAAAPAVPAPAAPANSEAQPYTVPPPPPGPIPTSEIEPIVPPWETGSDVPWPVQPSDPLLPELAHPWIAGIERERPRTTGPAQVPAPTSRAVPVPQAAPVPRAVPAPVRRGPAVNVVPNMPGPRDNTLYRVQVGAFKARLNAQEAFDRLLNAGFSPVFERQGGLIRVQIPWIRGYEVRQIGERLYNAGFREVWVQAER